MNIGDGVFSEIEPALDVAGFAGVDAVENVMGNRRLFLGAWFGSADVHMLIHGHGISIDDFAIQVGRQRNRQRRFAAGGGARDDNQRDLTHMLRLLFLGGTAALFSGGLLGGHFGNGLVGFQFSNGVKELGCFGGVFPREFFATKVAMVGAVAVDWAQ